MKSIVILISGRGSNMEAIVRAGLPAKVAAVISNRADAAGLKFAAQSGIPAKVVDEREFSSRGAFDAALEAAIERHSPERVTLTYELKRNGTVHIDVSETLEHDGRTYAITSEGRGRGILALFGVLKRTSRGHITPQGLRPDEFRDQRPGGWAVSAKFDWDARSVTQEKNGKPATLKMPAHARDL